MLQVLFGGFQPTDFPTPAGGRSPIPAEAEPQHPGGWKAVALPPWWPDILVEEDFHSTDFRWRVSKTGTGLRFIPK